MFQVVRQIRLASVQKLAVLPESAYHEATTYDGANKHVGIVDLHEVRKVVLAGLGAISRVAASHAQKDESE